MVNIPALLRSLPRSELQPREVARIGGLIHLRHGNSWGTDIVFLEPPAERRVPYIDPVEALAILFVHQGLDENLADLHAQKEGAELIVACSPDDRVVFYDWWEPDAPECVPVHRFLDWLRERRLISADVIEFLEQAGKATAERPIFRLAGNYPHALSMAELPDLPNARAMIEFVPGGPWAPYMEDEHRVDLFGAWREWIRPVAAHLEEVLGEPVYWFVDPDDEAHDDCLHRFLVLHWLCTFKPESTYVRYLVQRSGAENVHALKVALLDPANYTQPFTMNFAFFGTEVDLLEFDCPSA